MKQKIKTILASLSVLAMLSTTAVAYNINPPKLMIQSEERDLHINFNKDGSKFVYTKLNSRAASPLPSEIRLNEEGIEKIVTQGYSDTSPAFSPDGKKIAFFRNAGMGVGFICLVDSDGKNLQEIILTRITKASWSPDGKKIAYTDQYTEEKTKILTEKDIENMKHQYNTDEVGFKPGDKMEYKEHYKAISLVDIETKEVTYLTTNEGHCEEPEFTTDGRIVYVYNKNLDRTTGKEIWIMDKDGKNKQPLVQVEDYEKEIENADGTTTVYIKESKAHQVSVDGNLIAYLLETQDRIHKKIYSGDNYKVEEIKDEYESGIYVKNIKTGETKLITDEGALWFPEIKNRKVYFSRYDDFETEHNIYSIDLEK